MVMLLNIYSYGGKNEKKIQKHSINNIVKKTLS